MNTPLGLDHRVLGQDYCSGYADADGKWNTGFYCPNLSPDSATVYCCGSPVIKYCCNGKIQQPGSTNPSKSTTLVEMETEMEINSDYDPTVAVNPQDIGRNTYVAAIICGIVIVTVVMILVSCFYCSCCILYKKRRGQLSRGLYRIPASSTTCGLINSTNGPTTPSSTTTRSLVTSPLNPELLALSSEHLWGNPPPGQLSTTNLLQPPATLGAYVNHQSILDGSSRLSPGETRTRVIYTNQSHQQNNCQQSRNPPIQNPSPFYSSATNCGNVQERQPIYYLPISGNSSVVNANNANAGSISILPRNTNYVIRTNSLTSGSSNRSRVGVPVAFGTNPATVTAASSRQNSTSGTLSSLMSTMSQNSSNSLPPPYFIEQYRIRNRVRQPRNLNPTVALPSYNEVNREQIHLQTATGVTASATMTRNQDGRCGRPPLIPTPAGTGGRAEYSSRAYHITSDNTAMNDLSAPTRIRQNQVQNPRSIANGQIIQVSNVPISPLRLQTEASRDKILNTSTVQRTSSEAKRLRDEIEEIRKLINGRFRAKSHSLENVTVPSSAVAKIP